MQSKSNVEEGDIPSLTAIEPERSGGISHIEAPLREGRCSSGDRLETRVDAGGRCGHVLARCRERRLCDSVVLGYATDTVSNEFVYDSKHAHNWNAMVSPTAAVTDVGLYVKVSFPPTMTRWFVCAKTAAANVRAAIAVEKRILEQSR